MKRLPTLLLILLLVLSLPATAAAEGLAGVSKARLERLLTVWGLTVYDSSIQAQGYEQIKYADADFRTGAVLLCADDAVLIAVFMAYDNEDGKAFLREMSTSAVVGCNQLLQLLYGMSLDIAMEELTDGETRASTMDDVYYTVYRQGNLLYSVVADATVVDADGVLN